MKPFFFTCALFLFFTATYAQLAPSVEAIEAEYKACVQAKADSTPCSRNYLYKLDSMMNVVYDKVKSQVPSEEKAAFVKEQLYWVSRKDAFFKKQDTNFAFQIQDGTWKKDMIRIVYESKAEFILKRIKLLLKREMQ